MALHFGMHEQIPPWRKSVRENFSRPYGTVLFIPVFRRAEARGYYRNPQLLHPQRRKLVITHTL